MNKNLFGKKLFIIIITLFITASLVPIISGISINNVVNVNELNKNQDTSPITFYTFDKTRSKVCSIDLSDDVVEEIVDMIEDLKYKLINEPFSDETKSLKSDFVELLAVYGLLPAGMSRDKVLSLLNPFWLSWFDMGTGLMSKSSIFTSVNNVFNGLGFLKRFFLSPGIVDFLGGNPRPGVSASSLFCSVASGGQGIPFPLFLLPRPRGFVVWGGREICGTNVGNLLSGRGFIAVGPQNGVALGFLGVGLTYSAFGSTYYAFIGYSTFVYVNAYSIDWFAPPNAKPVVSNELPVDGAVDVPVSLPELSFRISDADGDRMDYSVSTSPNIGSGSGNFKKNGFYKVPVSGLKGNTEYTWRVVVNDEYDSVEKTFSFTTERIAPVVSDPLPFDGDGWVPLDVSELSFSLKDFQGDLMDYSVETSPDIGFGSGSGVGDGVYFVDVGGLDYTTVYYWFVNVTDGVYWTREVFSFKTQPIMFFDPFDEGWSYRKKITIDHDLVDGDLFDFPVLVSVVDDDLENKAQSDGDDILFMDGSGVANRLFHEIELYDDSDGELVAWVKTPEIDKDVDTVLYMYYGNTFCDSQEYPDLVWDDDFIHVWHLGNSLIDSAGFDDGSNHGTSIVSGKVGNARDFEKDEHDFITFGDMSQPGDGSLTTMTWECWIKPEAQDGIIMCKYDTTGTDYSSYYINFQENGRFRSTAYESNSARTDGITQNSYSNVGQWVYISSAFNLGGINDINIFINGDEVTVSFTANSGDNMRNIPISDDLGRYRPESGPKYADAVIDEVRWSKVVRSDAWIKTSFNTMDDSSSFMSFGLEETIP
jgi:hypothetical protein